MTAMTSISCQNCGFNGLKKLKEQNNHIFFRCKSCGLGFVAPKPEPNKLYGASYYDSWGLDRSEDSPEQMKKATFTLRFHEIEKYSTKGRFLDVGCATGYALEVARDRGWQVEGVELSDYSSSIAREKFGNAVHRGTIFDADLSDGVFDCVLLSDLLEHVPDPKATLMEASRVMKVGGILSIITPNIDSLSARITGASWMHFKLEHLYYFSPKVICSLLDEAGFEVLQIGVAKKAVNLKYLADQMKVYGPKRLRKIFASVSARVPRRIGSALLKLKIGEMEIIAKKRR